MVTNSITTFCKNTNIDSKKFTECDEFTILPASKCYPIPYQNFQAYYTEDGMTNALNIIETSKPFFVHVWNKMLTFSNRNFKLTFNSNSAYIRLAGQYCPKTLGTVEKYF